MLADNCHFSSRNQLNDLCLKLRDRYEIAALHQQRHTLGLVLVLEQYRVEGGEESLAPELIKDFVTLRLRLFRDNESKQRCKPFVWLFKVVSDKCLQLIESSRIAPDDKGFETVKLDAEGTLGLAEEIFSLLGQLFRLSRDAAVEKLAFLSDYSVIS